MSSATDAATIRVHQALAARLRQLDVEVLFGLAGDANLFMVDSYIRQQRGRYVAAAHEANVVLMALGYSQRAGKTGVGTVTHGPALTNTVTSLVEGVRHRVPMLLITGSTRADAPEHLQAIDHRVFVEATGAVFERCTEPSAAADALTAAYLRAGRELRPVVLEFPVELAWEMAPPPGSLAPPSSEAHRADRIVPDPAQLDDAAGALAVARRPLVVAGRGAWHARDEVVALAEQVGAPLLTTLQAKDLFAGHPDNLGLFGTLSTPAAVEAIANCDCVMFLGCGLNPLTTDQHTLTADPRVIAVNTDPVALERPNVDVPVLGDCALTATALTELLVAAEVGSTGYAQRASSAQRTPEADRGSGPGVVGLLDAISYLDGVVPVDRTLVLDGGQWMYTTIQALRVPGPDHFVTSTSFGSIGLGMGHAIGAAMAAPDQPTLFVTGDGGFMLGGLTEFATAVRCGLDLITIVCNDGGYGAEYIQYTARGLAPETAFVEWPDFVEVAKAMGASGVMVRSETDLELARDVVTQRRGPVLIDLRIAPPLRG